MKRALPFAMALALLAACGGAGPGVEADPGPVGVVEAWRDALVEGRPRDAWALLAPRAGQGLDEEAFVALYERQRDDLVAQAEDLLRVARTRPPEERARVRVGDRAVVLVRTREGWRVLRSAPLEPAAEPAPEGDQ
ncbi:MAG: hypothetical protein ACQEXJ_00355 [Myxococcota bacterium]